MSSSLPQKSSIKNKTHSSSKSSNNKFQLTGKLLESKGEEFEQDELGDLLDEADVE